MEKEEQNREQEEMEEEITLVARKSRNGIESKITEIDAHVSIDGASESNVHSENGAENGDLFIYPENEHKKIEQELDGVLENDLEEEEAINGEQKKEKDLVFFDKAEGEEQIVKTPGPEKLDISSSLDFLVRNNSTTAINNGYEGDLENNAFSGLNHKSSQISSLKHGTSHISKEIDSAGVGLTDGDDDLEVEELDIERVIQKQNTHDLYCPNCNSCITRRVVLQKRKRGVRVSYEEVKRNKIESEVGSVLGDGSVKSSGDHIRHTDAGDDNDAPIATADEDERERGPDIFRCLSCFSFFVPTGDGFKSFKLFRDKSAKEKIENEHAPTSVKKNWFTSMFASSKTEMVAEQGSGLRPNVRQGDIPDISSSNLSAGQSSQPSSSHDVLSPARASEGPVVGLMVTEDQSNESKSNKEVHVSHENKDAVQLSTPVSELTASNIDGNLNISVCIPHQEQDVRATILTESVLETKRAVFSSMVRASEHVTTRTGIEVHSGEPFNVNSISVLKGKDTIITIDSQLDELSETVEGITSLSETASLLQSPTQGNIAGRERTEERKEYEIEVIKSIVYGGLAESITSLSVVSSAAGGGAATLNILALGMANLIGGLFIICHNLWELKYHHHIEQVTNQISDQVTEQSDRYKELLGQRRNFILHAIVSIISYVIFGLVPPVVYGFSFRKTDDKRLKLVAAAAASLACIVFLAIGRAHVRTSPKPYLKSVVSFVVLGFMVSGVSYAAGELVERLLEKLGLFGTSPDANLAVNEIMMRSMGSAWASY
ncbi:hypothetical protein OROGR_022518 [Orobanche gracilis]